MRLVLIRHAHSEANASGILSGRLPNVHLSEKGHPVLGDKMYSKDAKGVKRLALHSSSLTIVHPFSKKEMTFKAPAPQDFNRLVRF